MNFSFERLWSWWSEIFAPARRGHSEYFAEQHLADVADDCGLSVHQLQRFLKHGPNAADELYATMSALGIDVAKVRASYRGTLRDMQVVCVDCSVKEICRTNLSAFSVSRRVHHYCENAWTFQLLPKKALP